MRFRRFRPLLYGTRRRKQYDETLERHHDRRHRRTRNTHRHRRQQQQHQHTWKRHRQSTEGPAHHPRCGAGHAGHLLLHVKQHDRHADRGGLWGIPRRHRHDDGRNRRCDELRIAVLPPHRRQPVGSGEQASARGDRHAAVHHGRHHVLSRELHRHAHRGARGQRSRIRLRFGMSGDMGVTAAADPAYGRGHGPVRHRERTGHRRRTGARHPSAPTDRLPSDLRVVAGDEHLHADRRVAGAQRRQTGAEKRPRRLRHASSDRQAHAAPSALGIWWSRARFRLSSCS